MSKRVKFFVQNDPFAMRIYPELAKEIGFNESIVLLQIEYLIGVSTTKEQDGDLWTYQSLENLRDDYFPWWSTATISRAIKKLEELNLIKIGNYNKLSFDRTQWFAINIDGCKNLKSIVLNDSIFQNEKCKRTKCKMDVDKMKNASLQNEMTIPETPAEISSQISAESNIQEIETDPIQRLFEVELGFMPSISDIKALDEFKSMGATIEDLREGIKWRLANNSAPIRNYAAVIQPTKTAMLKRTQQKFTSGKTRKVTNQDGEVVEIPA